jgi:hypothetical protein
MEMQMEMQMQMQREMQVAMLEDGGVWWKERRTQVKVTNHKQKPQRWQWEPRVKE